VNLGKRIFIMRHAFNLREGWRRKDATIQDRCIGTPPLNEGPLAGVTVDVERMATNFYNLMGFEQDGVPKKETLEAIGGLDNVIKDLYLDIGGCEKINA
jgi:aldehyde:ferredoxin oxidoreductase